MAKVVSPAVKSCRREGPVAVEAAEFLKLKPGEPDKQPNNAEADADYFGNLRKFQRHDDMSLPPTRKK